MNLKQKFRSNNFTFSNQKNNLTTALANGVEPCTRGRLGRRDALHGPNEEGGGFFKTAPQSGGG